MGEILEQQETTIQWDRERQELTCWTADPTVERRWRECGWPVEVAGTVNGKPRSWEVRGIPSDRVVFLKLPEKKPEN